MLSKCFFENLLWIEGILGPPQIKSQASTEYCVQSLGFPRFYRLENRDRPWQRIISHFLPSSRNCHSVSTCEWFHRAGSAGPEWNRQQPGVGGGCHPPRLLRFCPAILVDQESQRQVSDFPFCLSEVPGGSALCRRLCWLVRVPVRPGTLPKNLLH